MEKRIAKPRPKHLELNKIRMPIQAIVSILHRVSGAGLFLLIPFLLYCLQATLGSAEVFGSFKDFFANPLIKLILFGLSWAFMHHACAGVRYLFLDFHKGIDKVTTQTTSKMVVGVSLVLTLGIGAFIW